MNDEDQVYRVGVDLGPGCAYVNSMGGITMVMAVDESGFWLLRNGRILFFEHSSEIWVTPDRIVWRHS